MDFSLSSKLVNRVVFESSMTASLSYSAPSSVGMEQLTVLGLMVLLSVRVYGFPRPFPKVNL